MRALQAILIAGHDGEEMIRSGVKRCTFRMGERDYTNGPVLIGCHVANWAAMGEITDVMVARLDTLSPEQLAENKFKSTDHAVECLRAFYPSIQRNSDVTVIFFTYVPPVFVDEDGEEVDPEKLPDAPEPQEGTPSEEQVDSGVTGTFTSMP